MGSPTSYSCPRGKVSSDIATRKLAFQYGSVDEKEMYDPDAPQKLDIAFADYVHSNLLAFSQGECMKCQRIINIARTLPLNISYKLPNRDNVGGELLDAISDDNWNSSIKDFLKETSVFGSAVIADGATINNVPLFNIIAASPNNPMAILDIVDLSESCARGEEKNASFLATLMKPLIAKLENERNEHGRKLTGIVDLAVFDGAPNIQLAGEMLRVMFPRITVIHGVEHAIDLFFQRCVY